jgi:alpha-maltose-1-phosphate synthase
MRLTYVLLSPTFGMHQYTADLANGIADCRLPIADCSVRIVTTTTLPHGRYSPAVRMAMPVTTHGTGFAREGLDLGGYRRALAAIVSGGALDGSEVEAFKRPIVHFTGVHLWNVALVSALRRKGAAVIHTLHDLRAHGGVSHGRLIGLWNRLIIGSGAHLLVHGRLYREALIARGVAPSRITYAPLLHGFWGYEREQGCRGAEEQIGRTAAAPGEPSTNTKGSVVLFFGRVEPYKGVDVLLAAWETVRREVSDARLVIAGPSASGAMKCTTIRTSGDVEWRDRLIEDAEAIDLFRSASLLVLPYRDATQSALVASAYRFGVPVIVTQTGALPEYVVPGETGWLTPPGDSEALAGVLRTALADPGRLQAMGGAGRAWVDERRREEETALAAMYLNSARMPK